MAITDDLKMVERAAAMLARGATIEEFIERSSKSGRPATKMRITDVNGTELVIPKSLMVNAEKKASITALTVVKPMTDVEYAEMCKMAVPHLMDRAIKLASVTEDVKEVMLVLKELSDRGFGRVSKVQGETEEADYLRRSWEQFPAYKPILDVNAADREVDG